MECCGVNGYQDFEKTYSTKWKEPYGNIATAIDAPLVCCITEPTSAADTAFDCARITGPLAIHTEVT